jgi:hypothetical protein
MSHGQVEELKVRPSRFKNVRMEPKSPDLSLMMRLRLARFMFGEANLENVGWPIIEY